jgi:hypothetical protein
MADDDVSIAGTICLDRTYDDSVRDREYWCPDRSPDIDTDMTPVILPVVESIAPHMPSDVGIAGYHSVLAPTRILLESELIVERDWEILRYGYIFEPLCLVGILWLGPIRDIGDRHRRPIEWITHDPTIAISSSVHIWYPDLVYRDSHTEETIGHPDSDDRVLYVGIPGPGGHDSIGIDIYYL